MVKGRLAASAFLRVSMGRWYCQELGGERQSAQVCCSKACLLWSEGASRLSSATALCIFLISCGGSQTGISGKGPERGNLPKRETSLEAEGCATDSKRIESLDADGDGHPEILRVMNGKREICRTVDLNFDGRIDRTSYFDKNGALRRVESDFDRDGLLDEIALFKSGQLSEKWRAATPDGKIDTWDEYKRGVLFRTERDQNGDGIVDQWWEYPRTGCPLIHIDRDGDGRPDPGASIDYCAATGEEAGSFVPTPPTPTEPIAAPVPKAPSSSEGTVPDSSLSSETPRDTNENGAQKSLSGSTSKSEEKR